MISIIILGFWDGVTGEVQAVFVPQEEQQQQILPEFWDERLATGYNLWRAQTLAEISSQA